MLHLYYGMDSTLEYIFKEMIIILETFQTKCTNSIEIYLQYKPKEKIKQSIELVRCPHGNFTKRETSINLEDGNITLFSPVLDTFYFSIPKKEIDFIMWLIEEIIRYNLDVDDKLILKLLGRSR